MFLTIIILPLLGSIVSGFFGRKAGVRGGQIITTTCVIITTVLAVFAFLEVGTNNIPVSIHLFRWIDSEWFSIDMSFQFDSLTVAMLLPVLIISSLVHIYSISYMSHDPHNQRFFSYLSLFTFMMIILVTADNYLLMFVGWEGVGVCSYLLVSFWFTRIAANQSSMSAFLTNRVGDCFLTIGMFTILWSLGNLGYGTVFSLAPYINENIVTIIGICLLIGAMAKSSQVGLHVWLPMAMEGPTPVSALIHAATMVTAGVYLLMRSSPLIEYSSTVLFLCLWLGVITTVFSSLVGLFQQDIKKVIAYSTMSQLGMMVIAVGLSSYNLALFHLINHAFYKALLFLGAGSVIHAVADNQDFRKYGGLISYLPLTYSSMLIASLSLVALPFLTGFYSKDFILESAYGQFSFSGLAVYIIATIGAIFTTLYSVKVLYLTFLTTPNGPRWIHLGGFISTPTKMEALNWAWNLPRLSNHRVYSGWTTWNEVLYYYSKLVYFWNTKSIAHEGNIFMTLPLVILALFSIFWGFITKDIFIGLGSNFFIDNSIFIHPIHEIMIDTEFAVPTLYKLLPFFCTISFSLLALIFSGYFTALVISFKLSRLGYNIFGFFNQRFLIEYFYNKYITNLILELGGQTTKVLDKGSIELLGPYGLEKFFIGLSKSLNELNTSIIPDYGLYFFVAFISYIILLFFNISDGLLILIITLYSSLQNYSNSKEKKSNINLLLARFSPGMVLEFLTPDLVDSIPKPGIEDLEPKLIKPSSLIKPITINVIKAVKPLTADLVDSIPDIEIEDLEPKLIKPSSLIKPLTINVVKAVDFFIPLTVGLPDPNSINTIRDLINYFNPSIPMDVDINNPIVSNTVPFKIPVFKGIRLDIPSLVIPFKLGLMQYNPINEYILSLCHNSSPCKYLILASGLILVVQGLSNFIENIQDVIPRVPLKFYQPCININITVVKKNYEEIIDFLYLIGSHIYYCLASAGGCEGNDGNNPRKYPKFISFKWDFVDYGYLSLIFLTLLRLLLQLDLLSSYLELYTGYLDPLHLILIEFCNLGRIYDLNLVLELFRGCYDPYISKEVGIRTSHFLDIILNIINGLNHFSVINGHLILYLGGIISMGIGSELLGDIEELAGILYEVIEHLWWRLGVGEPPTELPIGRDYIANSLIEEDYCWIFWDAFLAFLEGEDPDEDLNFARLRDWFW